MIRAALTAVLLLTALPAAAREPMELSWGELMPEPIPGMPAPMGTVEHGDIAALPSPDAGEVAMVEGLDGEYVRLLGFVVPVDFIGKNVKQFLLVPYVGACIHVPPPPANQIVYVTAEDGAEIAGLFQPVEVTGTMRVAPLSTELAEVGYRIEAETVEPYEFEQP